MQGLLRKWFGLPVTTAVPVAFCMPESGAVWESFREAVTTDTTDLASNPAVRACRETGCNPSHVGDGFCNGACNNAACRADGGDCSVRTSCCGVQ